MSDVITMTPATSFGPCVAGTVYPNDIYRDGEDDWKDIDMNPILAHGTDEAPVDDHVTLFLTRDPSAVIARGASENQTIELLSDLVVPAQSTFFWNAEGSITTEGGFCSLQPGRPEFQ